MATAPAAAVSSFRAVSISAPNFHKNTLRIPFSNNRVCAAPNLCSESVLGTFSNFNGPNPIIGETAKSQAGARQDFESKESDLEADIDEVIVSPGTNGIDVAL